MKRKAIIISAAVFSLLIGSAVYSSKFMIECKGQTVKTSAAYASCSYLDYRFERRFFCVDSIINIENRSIRPIKLSKVAFVGDRTGIIKEFVNESNTIQLAPGTIRCFAATNDTIPAEEYERPQFPPLAGQVAEGVSFHVQWEAETRVTAPIITAELIKPLLPLFSEPIMPNVGACNCEVIDQW